MLDIKLKKFSRVWYTKLIVFVVMIICSSSIFGLCLGAINQRIMPFGVRSPNYRDSYQFKMDADNYVNAVLNQTYIYKDKTFVLDDQNVDEAMVQRDLQESYQNYIATTTGEVRYYDNNGNEIQVDSGADLSEVSTDLNGTAANFMKLSKKEFLKAYPELEKGIRQVLVQNNYSEYLYNENIIKKAEGFVYKKATNLENIEDYTEFYKTLPEYYYMLNGISQTNNSFAFGSISQWIVNHPEITDINNGMIVFGASQEYMAAKQQQWEADYKITKDYTIRMLILMGIGLLCFIYLALVTGRKTSDDKLHYYPVDKIFTEIQIAIAFLAIILASEVSYSISRVMRGGVVEFTDNFNNTLLIFVLSSTVLICIIFALSQIRRLKGKQFLNGFIIYRVCYRIWKAFIHVWFGSKLMKRAIILAIVVPLLSATWIGTPFVIAILLYFVYKYVNDLSSICTGVEKVRQGKLGHKIEVKNPGDLQDLADNINSLSSGLSEAVSSELKAERMKTQLISNVSHDIKTPLTSIITYVDLLKKEELNNEAATGYIEVLEKKAQRLKMLTNDLFEAAKATSGDLPVNLGKVDLQSLIKQALGEFDGKFEKAALDPKIVFPSAPVAILADGKLMWRVLENLFSNVVKYAQTGSRVYIEAVDEVHVVHLFIKNISAYELNIAVDDLMERFTRGDESRSSEGSGLGLNIAKSLVGVQNGTFQISIDGDLFKVTITMPKYVEENYSII